MTERDVLDVTGKVQNPPDLRADSMEGWSEIGEGWADAAFSLGLDTSPFFTGMRGSDAVGLAIAIQCADVKARDIAKADLNLWRHAGQTKRLVTPGQHWLARLLARRPNTVHTWGEFWRMVVLHLDLAQNAFILKRIARDGTVLELLPLMPARVRPWVTQEGELFYQVHAGTLFEQAQLGAPFLMVPASRMIHLRGRMWDGLNGLSNRVLGHPTFVLLKAISDYQTHLFASDGKLPMAFVTKESFPGDQSDAAFRRLKEQITIRYRRMMAGGDPLLLENGIEPKPLGTNANDALATQTYNQQILRVCGFMMTPPHKIFALESVKYDNMSHADDQYANDCLVPLAGMIEERLRNDLLTEEEWDTLWPEFDRESILAGDRVSMNARIEMGVKNGLMTVNEGRARLSLNPIAGGNVRLVPVTMALYDQAGTLVSHAAEGQADPGTGTDAQAGGNQAAARGLRLVSGE
ncbi:phage portal protein [Methylobacterium sp. JK268]